MIRPSVSLIPVHRNPNLPFGENIRDQYMKRTIGILVIGQSPRPALEAEFRRVIPASVDIRLEGVLDGMTPEDRDAMAPQPGDDTLFAVLPDGSDIRLSHRMIADRAPQKLQALQDSGCSTVLFCCTGEFPEIEDRPFLLPAPILTGTVSAVVRSGHLGVFGPLPEQIGMITERWQAAGAETVSAVALAPTASDDEIVNAAGKMAAIAPDYVVYDCMSYGHRMRRCADSVVKRPSIMSVSLVARVLAELVDAG